MTSRCIFLCTRPWGAEAQEWVLFVEGFHNVHDHRVEGTGMGFICSVGFIYFKYTTMGRGGAGVGFLLLKDFITYTTTGPRGDGVGFNCSRT